MFFLNYVLLYYNNIIMIVILYYFLQVTVPLPQKLKTRDVEVKIEKKRLKVAIKGQAEPIIDNALYNEIKMEDSHWTLEGLSMLINLEKVRLRP